MVDIETTNNDNFERGGIIQIAAVKFNYETGEIDPDMFDRCLRLMPGREWDVGTRQWWAKQGNVLQTIEARAEDPLLVIQEFHAWLLKDWPSDRKEGRQFWSKPTHFDFSFLASYFRWCGLDMPCGFRYARDLNSFMAGLSGNRNHPTIEDELTMDGPAHNAIFDVLFQIKALLEMKNRSTQYITNPDGVIDVVATPVLEAAE